MDPALREALAALRALGDPTRAFGANRARGMQAFAAAAHERGVQLHDEPAADSPLTPIFPNEAQATGAAQVWQARGITVKVEKVRGGFVVAGVAA